MANITRALEPETKATMLAALEDAQAFDLVPLLAEADGQAKLPHKTWAKIDQMVELYKARKFTQSEDGHGKVIAVEEFADNPDGMSDDEVVELNQKMDLLLDPRAVYEGNVVYVPDDLIAEIEAADRELDEVAYPLCHCGCGGRTKGGLFVPGHDAKLKSALMRKVFMATVSGDDETRDSARLELTLRGWEKFYPAFARNEVKRQRRAKTPKCDTCGRPLSDEESIERGTGPVCAGRHN